MTSNILEKESTKLNAALYYSSIGLPVFPCHSWIDGRCTCENPACESAAKHPLTVNGCKDASTNAEKIADWWNQTQGLANVAIATGEQAGIVVLDVDPKSGGHDSLAKLEAQHGALPATPTVRTGSGGKHFYFKYPAKFKVGNRTGIAPGIDVRGNGGYVIAPPSHHANGEKYESLVPLDQPCAELPAWLLERILQPPAKSTETISVAKTNGMVLKMAGSSDDLSTNSGVAQGERNATLCRLVGVHLARGEDPSIIETLALAWAERCSPPLSEAEVVRTVRSLAAKHQRTVSMLAVQGDGDAVDAVPLPEPLPWPALNPSAYHGLVGEIVHAIEPETEADPVALLLSTLASFGNAIGREPFFPVEATQHHTNLDVVIVGKSSKGRKGVSEDRTLSLFDDGDDWKCNCLTSGLSSGEGLIWAVRDPIESVEPVREKGKIVNYQVVVKDPGIADKRLLVIESEFAQTLRVLSREGNTLSAIIRQAWDKGTLRALTKNCNARATNAHISILGHITQPELAKYLTHTDCFNGFANRFLWALVKRSKLLPDGGKSLNLAALRQRLAEALKAAKSVQEMCRSKAARELWHTVYQELASERHGLYGAVTGRAEAQTLRLSMLYALLDGVAIIDVPHLEAAFALWEYCDASARIIFGEGEGEADDSLEKLLLEVIRENPGISRRGLHKAVGGHVQAVVLVQALARLRDKGLIEPIMVPTGGRPKECWYPCEQTSKVQAPAEVGRSSEQTNEVQSQDESQSTCEQTSIAPPEEAPPSSEPKETGSSLARTSEPEITSVGEGLCSLARSPKQEAPISAPAVMTLAELDKVVKSIGGRFVRQGDRCIVDAPAGTVTPAIEAALRALQDELMALFSAPISKAEPYANAEAVFQAVSKKGGSITKDDDGKCILSWPFPDAELAEAFIQNYDEICKNVLSEKELIAEMEQIRLMGRNA